MDKLKVILSDAKKNILLSESSYDIKLISTKYLGRNGKINLLLQEIKKMRKEKVNVAISAHGNSMRPFRKYFEHLTREKMMQLENPWDDYFEYTIDV